MKLLKQNVGERGKGGTAEGEGGRRGDERRGAGVEEPPGVSKADSYRRGESSAFVSCIKESPDRKSLSSL